MALFTVLMDDWALLLPMVDWESFRVFKSLVSRVRDAELARVEREEGREGFKTSSLCSDSVLLAVEIEILLLLEVVEGIEELEGAVVLPTDEDEPLPVTK